MVIAFLDQLRYVLVSPDVDEGLGGRPRIAHQGMDRIYSPFTCRNGQ